VVVVVAVFGVVVEAAALNWVYLVADLVVGIHCRCREMLAV